MEVVLLDRHLGSEDGLELLPRVMAAFPDVPVVLVTSDSKTEVAVEAMRRGAFDFLPKPFDEARLLAMTRVAAKHHRLQKRVADIERAGDDSCAVDAFEGIIGTSPAMRAAFQILRHVGPTDATVLITGESGTGKELVARAVHNLSSRRTGPFVPLNMAALPRELVEATLFGHEKGAFTGADRRRDGAAGQAQGGTLFLDEIGEMPLELQTKLLRFLQERVFRPVGATEDVAADVRIVSATNRDPMEEVRAGRLRADLYYRLSVVPVQLPPLRHRPGDVELIAMYALRRFARRYGKRLAAFEDEAAARLVAHDWPGNVRELVHLIERICVLHDGAVVTEAMIPTLTHSVPAPPTALPTATHAPLHAALQPVPADAGTSAKGAGTLFGDEVIPLETLERMAVEHALRLSSGSPTLAATRLGMSTATIYRKIKEWGLSTKA